MRAATLDARVRGRDSQRDWTRGRAASWVRASLQSMLLLPLLRWLGRPMRVAGAHLVIGDGPFVFVANHASHADTAAILAALPARIRRRTAPAAAADYFFSSRVRGAFVTLLTGAFPFPRRGRAGLDRAEVLLRRGWSIVMFPEGTRSCDGRVAEFKPGVAALAHAGWTVVPIGVAGTRAVLPKGARLPRRSPIAVSFGSPIRVGGSDVRVHEQLERRVKVLARDSARWVAGERVPMHARISAFARSPRALVFCFAWGVAEALFFPVIPDFAVVPLALAAPARALPLALCATAGSVVGGAGAYLLGATAAGHEIAAHLPLVTERMGAFARDSMAAGPEGLLRQPLSGVPYKAFAYQASGAGLEMLSFLWFSLLARGARLLAVAGLFAVVGAGARAVWKRVFGVFLVVYAVCFVIGLARVVASWS